MTGRGLIAAAAALAAAPALAGHDLDTRVYRCDRGAQLTASYINSDSGASAVLAVEGRVVALNEGPTGSGARYAPPPGQDGYVWHTKGGAGVLLWQSSGEDRVIYQDCVEQD
ncbi:MAG: MliC family protein [Pseudodonghicola sp.]